MKTNAMFSGAGNECGGTRVQSFSFGPVGPAAGTRACAIAFVLLVLAISSTAQTFKTLLSFNDTDGADPLYAPLVQGSNGNLYGTTPNAADENGNLFEIAPSGAFTTLYTFCSEADCIDGRQPYGGLALGASGNFYGTTVIGGAHDAGEVFEITTAGKLTVLYSFCALGGCTDGEYPYAGLVRASNGNFYGATAEGGANSQGTIFEITPAGELTTLYSFCAQTNCTDGTYPTGALVQGTNGNFYGTTEYGGANGEGSVFEITVAGTLTTLYSFCSVSPNCADGYAPLAGLAQAKNGNFYGTAPEGGANGYGTVFEITATGKFDTLYNFCAEANCADGALPRGGLIQATNGDLYGTTVAGGTESGCDSLIGCGAIFKITPAGELTTLYSFCSQSDCTDGASPNGALVQATNGTFFGTTTIDGSVDCECGTIFSFSAGLGPFVETLPTSGKVGATVRILGNKLTGATEVTFDGTAATFTVVSASQIDATVPTGATTGTVEVTTSSGSTLASNVSFRVLP
ncbi:MAG: choice-of-anchor tandem repeat GloVer-containing protein [Candidatus Sulfotelmatobacter sp.]